MYLKITNKKIIYSMLLLGLLSACAPTPVKKTSTSDPQEQARQQWANELKNGVPIYFAHNSSQLEQKYQVYLSTAAAILKSNQGFALEVEGHTDNIGNIKTNNRISLERANTIRNLLVMQYGVNPNQIQTAGAGPAQPIASNETVEGRALNRRVVLTLKIQ